jgi:hypothetical protein
LPAARVSTTFSSLQLGAITEEADESGRRRFHVGDIASVYHGRLVSLRGTEGILDLFRYLTDDQTVEYSFQIPRLLTECRQHVVAQFSELSDLPEPPTNVPTRSPAHVDWLHTVSLTGAGGAFRPIEKLPPGIHTVIDPAVEFQIELGPFKKAVIVDSPELEP